MGQVSRGSGGGALEGRDQQQLDSLHRALHSSLIIADNTIFSNISQDSIPCYTSYCFYPVTLDAVRCSEMIHKAFGVPVTKLYSYLYSYA